MGGWTNGGMNKSTTTCATSALESWILEGTARSSSSAFVTLGTEETGSLLAEDAAASDRACFLSPLSPGSQEAWLQTGHLPSGGGD